MWLIQIDARLADAPQAERTTETATQAPIGLADGQGFEPGTPLTEVPEYKAAPPADAIYEPFSNYTANYTAALLLTRSTQGTVEQLPYARRYAEGNLVVARENLARALLETRNNDAAQAKQQLAKLIKDSSIDIPLSEKNLLTDTIDRIAEEDAVKDLLARLAGPDEASRNRALIDASTALPVQLSSANFASQRAEGQRPATAMLNCATPEGETRYDASQLQWLIAYLPADALVGAVVNSKADAENLRNLRKLQGTAREIIGSVEEMQESESGLSWQEAFDKAVLQVRHRLMQLAGQGASVVFYSINSLPSSYPGMNVISPDITQGPEVIVNWLNGMLTQAGVIASEQPACDRALRILGGMV